MERGGIKVRVGVQGQMVVIAAESVYQDPPDRILYIGDKPIIPNHPTVQAFEIPLSFLDGHQIIGMLEKEVENLIKGFNKDKN